MKKFTAALLSTAAMAGDLNLNLQKSEHILEVPTPKTMNPRSREGAYTAKWASSSDVGVGAAAPLRTDDNLANVILEQKVYSTLVNSNTFSLVFVETSRIKDLVTTTTDADVTNFNFYAYLNLYGWDIRFMDNIFTIFLSDFTFCDKIWYKADFLKVTLSFAIYTTDIFYSLYDYLDTDVTQQSTYSSLNSLDNFSIWRFGPSYSGWYGFNNCDAEGSELYNQKGSFEQNETPQNSTPKPPVKK